MNVTLGHYLTLGAVLFALSVIGIFLNRKNLIVLLMAIELMLLASTPISWLSLITLVTCKARSLCFSF